MYAENILTLIFRTKTILQKNWYDVCKFLIPILPLILCYARTKTKFGRVILSLVEPESEHELSTIVLVKSNIALLYCRDAQIQDEAIYRLMYLLQNIPMAENYMPNLNCIADVISSNICIVEPLPYSNCEDFCDLYEIRLINDLLNVLQNSNTEPSIRHSTLTQLNMIVEDPVALNHFHEINGHSIILKTLDASLQEKPNDNYPQNAIQIVGILTKMCLRIPSFRRQLEDDIKTYVLIVRTLFLFHADDKAKQECAVLLFSLAFSGFILGGNKQYILPPVCKKLLLPITCEFSWKSSLEQCNLLELILAHEKSHNFLDTNSNCTSLSDESSAVNPIIRIPQIWHYIRLNFNALWFGSLDQLIDCPYFVDGNKPIKINYKTNPNSLSFNQALCATTVDLEFVEGMSQKYGLNYWLMQLKNATTCQSVMLSCAAIENFSNVDATGHRKQWNCKLFLQSITRFCTIIPNNQQDEMIFVKICRLLANLIERDFMDVHIWILEKFNEKKCIYLDLIDDSKASTTVFLANIQFIEIVLAKTIDIKTKKIIQQLIYRTFANEQTKSTALKNNKTTIAKSQSNLFERIFEMAIKRLDTLLNEKRIGIYGTVIFKQKLEKLIEFFFLFFS